MHHDTSLRNTSDVLQQWEKLIMEPAKALSEGMVGPIVIVIDVLDESGSAHSRFHLLRILADENITKLPPHTNFGDIATSRRYPEEI
jgi:hypothetical protein